MRYSLIMFDSDGTLLDFAHAERTAFFRAFEHFGVPVGEDELKLYSKINDDCWKMLERKEITKPQLFTRRFSEFLKEINVKLDPAEVNKTYLSFLSQDGTVLPGVIPVLEKLSVTHELVIITNGTDFVQRGRLADSKIEKYFTHTFISDVLGVQKPDRCFFDIALEQLGRTDRENMLVVGDSLTSDIRGANNAGIDACWYNPNKTPKRDGFDVKYEINQLSELFDIV